MNTDNSKHLIQIAYFHQGRIFDAVKKKGLKELIEMRDAWVAYDNPILYRREDRKTYQRQLASIEQCICILFSEVNPEKVKQQMAQEVYNKQPCVIDDLLQFDKETWEALRAVQRDQVM